MGRPFIKLGHSVLSTAALPAGANTDTSRSRHEPRGRFCTTPPQIEPRFCLCSDTNNYVTRPSKNSNYIILYSMKSGKKYELVSLYRGWMPSVFCVLGECPGRQRPTKVFVGVPRFTQQLRKHIAKAAAPGCCRLCKRASEFYITEEPLQVRSKLRCCAVT